MILLAGGAFLASGCVYKMSIQQGNYLVAESVSQLKEGMTRSQVRFLLGTPMVPDAFDDSRWDYYYFFSSRKIEEPLKRRLTVYFA
jgi:outer membrane protein assembly factor BamE